MVSDHEHAQLKLSQNLTAVSTHHQQTLDLSFLFPLSSR